jgi:hypothetical protein
MDSGTRASLNSVWGSSGDDVFAVGDSGTILHFDGSTWNPMSSGTEEPLNDVWGNSATRVFAVGESGTILRYNGTNWTSLNSGTTQNLKGVWGSSATDVYVVGSGGAILHYEIDLEDAGLVPPHPSDAAMITDLPAGAYTVHVNPDDTSGVGLAEVYDLETDSDTSFLLNISARAYVQTNENILIAGFIIEGTGTKKVVIRGIGQGLSAHGVATSLDATIEIYDADKQIIGTNDDYADGDSVSELEEAGLVPSDGTDSALVLNLRAGAYTVHLVPKTASGIGLAEVYDLEPKPGSALLYNISSRAYVQTGDNNLVAGFVIGGTGTKKVAIRGIGQGLVSHGVDTDLNASIEVYDSNAEVIAVNERWKND